jgi:hypothetical protein
MPAKTPRSSARAKPEESEEAKFAAWLKDFDARHAEMVVRLDALLYSFGIDPVRSVKHDAV